MSDVIEVAKQPQAVTVYDSAAFCVTNGANMGDPLSFADELQPDDIYTLDAEARRTRLLLRPVKDRQFLIDAQSEAGTPTHRVILDSALTFMSPDGSTTEVLVLVEVDSAGDVEAVYALPLAPMVRRGDYTLVGVDRENAPLKLAQVACVSFTRGTMITVASGAQVPIEELEVGDRVLTRDDGPQEVRWIGQTTVRAVGALAPIVISAGTLNNAGDLVVSPDHRLFIYQRQDHLGAGRSELLVKARHLVNEDSVYQMQGGYVDYFQLIFDDHQIIYAEGIAAESLLVDTRTRDALPRELSKSLADKLRRHNPSALRDYEVTERLLNRPDAAAVLRKSSTG
ncbi:Hint domain-containing protein [Pseudaestuariivita sp.]|uniref:Hint domain-containing protein n=1 Tax=Pseudaestuariivita sp. TaxID=2211669 RepID=UPI0040596945